MLDDTFMDELLKRALHSARRPGWVEFKGDVMIADVRKEYGLDEPSAEAQLSAWLASRGGVLEPRLHDSGPPRGSKFRTAGSTVRYLVAFLPDAAVREASPRASAMLWPISAVADVGPE